MGVENKQFSKEDLKHINQANKPMTFIFHLFTKTEKHVAHQPGYGQWSSMVVCM